MSEIDANMEWINRNLATTIDTLVQDDVDRWENLFRADEKRFYTEAIYGFSARQRQLHASIQELQHSEIMMFCKEFLFKLRLAATGKAPKGLRLFEISHIEVPL